MSAERVGVGVTLPKRHKKHKRGFEIFLFSKLGSTYKVLPNLCVFASFFFSCSNSNPSIATIPYTPTPYRIQEPSYFVKLQVPDNNQLTVEGIALGRHLFYDPILSRDSTISCASCHQQDKSFSDGLALSEGVDGRRTKRSAMPIINLAYHYKNFFWDGRTKTLEEQALEPIIDTLEMDFNWESVEERLQQHVDYPFYFRKAFGIENPPEITKELTAKAIAQFERSMVSYNSKYDRVVRAEAEYTEEEFRGHQIFFDADEEHIPTGECAHCHTEPLFTNLEFFNNGIQLAEDLDAFKDEGRGEVTNYYYDKGKFKTPTLRNIALTAPYMHDGRFQTLEEVIDHYISGGHFTINVSPNVRQLKLTEADKKALIAFLHCLTDSTFIEEERFSDPFLNRR